MTEAGSSPTLAFTVTSDPPLAEDTQHTLVKTIGKDKSGYVITERNVRFKVEHNCITFRGVRMGDSGTYTISCHNDVGEIGKAQLVLEVKQPVLEPPQPQSSKSKLPSFAR